MTVAHQYLQRIADRIADALTTSQLNVLQTRAGNSDNKRHGQWRCHRLHFEERCKEQLRHLGSENSAARQRSAQVPLKPLACEGRRELTALLLLAAYELDETAQ